MSMKPRLSIRVALLMIALIGGALAVARWNDPALRYRRDHDQVSLHAVLSGRIANGDTIERIEAFLGPGKVNTNPKLRRAAATIAMQSPKESPQGVSDGDEFREYASGPGVLSILQFRGGRLVNFNPRDYAGPAVPVTGASR
jgi:hypothetical protein